MYKQPRLRRFPVLQLLGITAAAASAALADPLPSPIIEEPSPQLTETAKHEKNLLTADSSTRPPGLWGVGYRHRRTTVHTAFYGYPFYSYYHNFFPLIPFYYGYFRPPLVDRGYVRPARYPYRYPYRHPRPFYPYGYRP